MLREERKGEKEKRNKVEWRSENRIRREIGE